MERRRLILGVGLLALGGFMFVTLQRLNQPVVQTVEVPTTPIDAIQNEFVLFAVTDVQRGGRLDPAQLEWREWPADSISPTFIVQDQRPQAIEELSNSVVRSDIFTGEPINESKLVRAGDSGLMAALLTPGMRAVTTRVSTESAAGGFIMPGDRVDIIQTLQLPRNVNNTQGQQDITQYAATTVFEDVKVLAINQTFQTGPETPAAVAGVSFATFEMNQRDAELLEETAEGGTLSLTLRSVRGGTPLPSSSRKTRSRSESSTMVVYRNGQQTQVAVRGN